MSNQENLQLERCILLANINTYNEVINKWKGTVHLQGYTTDTTEPCVLASGLAGTQNVGGMIGNISVSVSEIVVTNWT